MGFTGDEACMQRNDLCERAHPHPRKAAACVGIVWLYHVCGEPFYGRYGSLQYEPDQHRRDTRKAAKLDIVMTHRHSCDPPGAPNNLLVLLGS